MPSSVRPLLPVSNAPMARSTGCVPAVTLTRVGAAVGANSTVPLPSIVAVPVPLDIAVTLPVSVNWLAAPVRLRAPPTMFRAPVVSTLLVPGTLTTPSVTFNAASVCTGLTVLEPRS